MKKTFIIIAIISTLLAGMLVGCRVATQMPGVTAIQSALPTLPMVSPSPVASPSILTSTPPAATIKPAMTTPKASTMPKVSASKKVTP